MTDTERTFVPKPAGGIQTDEQEAKWLADTIDLRTREAVEKLAGIRVAPRGNDSLDRLILICIEQSVARNTKALQDENSRLRDMLRRVMEHGVSGCDGWHAMKAFDLGQEIRTAIAQPKDQQS